MNYHYSLRNSPEERSTRSVILLAITCVTFSDVKVGKFEPVTSRHAGSKGATCRSGTPIVWLQFFYKSCLFLAYICNYNRKARLRVSRGNVVGIPAGTRDILLRNAQTGAGVHPTSYSIGTGGQGAGA
jgi:hypothetical protein